MTATAPVYAMCITPFREDGELDEDALRQHLRYLADRGVGVYLCSQGSGEGDFLSTDEKLRVYRIGVEELKGRCPVYAAGVGLGGSTEAICSLAREVEATGVDAIQVLGGRPGGTPLIPREVEAYFDRVAGSVSCDVHVSDNAFLTGYRVPPDLVARLAADHPNIRAVNLAHTDVGVVNRTVLDLLDLVGDRLEVRVSITSCLPMAVALGAHGYLSFEANVAPRLAATTWQRLSDGDSTDGTALFALLLRLSTLLSRWPNPRSLKDGLAALGRNGGRLRPPYQHLDGDERAQLTTGLRELGIAEVEAL